MPNSSQKVDMLPTPLVSEAIIKRDAPAALAFLRNRGADDPEIIEALGLDKYNTEMA